MAVSEVLVIEKETPFVRFKPNRSLGLEPNRYAGLQPNRYVKEAPNRYVKEASMGNINFLTDSIRKPLQGSERKIPLIYCKKGEYPKLGKKREIPIVYPKAPKLQPYPSLVKPNFPKSSVRKSVESRKKKRVAFLLPCVWGFCTKAGNFLLWCRTLRGKLPVLGEKPS